MATYGRQTREEMLAEGKVKFDKQVPRATVTCMADWKDFSLAEACTLRIEPDWEPLKDQGNAAYKRGDFKDAVELYGRAAIVARGPRANGAASAFVACLNAQPSDSAHWRLANNTDCMKLVVAALPKGPPKPVAMPSECAEDGVLSKLKCAYPNKAEAIAWANQAVAYTGLKNHREALAAARRATKACPEYVKGHTRELHALQALGKTVEAEDVEICIDEYIASAGLNDCGNRTSQLLAAAWISWEDAMLVYFVLGATTRGQLLLRAGLRVTGVPDCNIHHHHFPEFEKAALSFVRGECDRDAIKRQAKADARAKKQREAGGQPAAAAAAGGGVGADGAGASAAEGGAEADEEGRPKEHKVWARASLVPFQAHVVNNVSMVMVDPDHEDDLSLPPHGKATKMAHKHALTLIPSFIKQTLLEHFGLRAAGLMLGQGMTDMCHRMEGALARSGMGSVVNVYASQSTAASQEAMEAQMDGGGGMPPGWPNGAGLGNGNGCAQQR
ncbi:hypothetical protein FOA52_009666 [Chlamydomonas sp. UWO 241]|nr:hypothetical protein FOA52_009666 [Chlamydomonas sp. UWO 241]